jgi:TolB-like protein
MESHMKKLSLFFTVLFVTARLVAQTNSTPVRLALIVESSEAATVGDVLTAELSKNGQIHLLERTEIEKVYREQGLSAGNKDYLKLGQILGADGLLLMNIVKEGTNQIFNIRLIAVKPGVVLIAERFSWPVANLTEWSPAFARHLDLFLPKLSVLVKDAIPISVVNLRSAISSADAMESERQLTLLAIERLSREPHLFVLERRKMQLLTGEKELKGLDDSAFWNGSYLLDGTLDNSGHSKDTITISARLVPPQGGTPISIEVSGSRTNYAEVINRLTDKLLENLNLGHSRATWNAADEAEQFYAEAQWALKWELYPQAQAAAESAWALGKKNTDAALLLIRAYTESVPGNPINLREICVRAIPDANQFAPLARALDLLSQNASTVFAGTNSANASAFALGVDLLRRGAGLLESYYYAAEARASHAEQLSELREKMRQGFKAMDAHPLSKTDKIPSWNDPRRQYNDLKWKEGGVCFDHPETALPFYHELLNSGDSSENLPRVIGWTWEDRQRVPALMRQFVNDVCADTKPAVQLEGLYLAMLLAPEDEKNSLQRSEQALISAMWEKHQWLLGSAENASLVERTKNSLRVKYDAGNANDLYNREPFASFKQRLRIDFLEHTSDTNLAIFWTVFPNTSEQTETPEQARELLPLVVSYQQKLPKPRVLNGTIQHLRQVAGIVDTNPDKPVTPAQPAENVLEAKFIKWNLSRPGIDSGRTPLFHGMIVRGGRMWLRVRYVEQNNGWSPDFQTTYLAVNPQNGVSEEISFPAKLGVPGDLFEVTSNALFVETGDQLYRFTFQKKIWEEISAPMEGSSQLVWLKDRLFVGRNDGLLTVQPDSKTVQLLVSSRREPPANEIDPLWTPQTRIYPQADGQLGALTEDRCFTFDPDTEHWTIRTMPLTGTNRHFSLSAAYTSLGGSQWLLTGPVAHRYLVGFWNDNRPAE